MDGRNPRVGRALNVLYITQNGITDHIGRSQVAPYLLGLARLGYRIHVLSAEKDALAALVPEYQDLFDAAGIRWTRIKYHNSPPLVGTLFDLVRMYRAARVIIRREGIGLVHCRSFPPALIGHRLKKELGVKFIFDFRDFYADGGLHNKRFKFIYRRLKAMEGPMLRASDKVVCLTERARNILAGWYFADMPASEAAGRFQVIPCCADFDLFDPEQVAEADAKALARRAGLADGDFVLLYLGSLGPDYLLPQMMQLFAALLEIVPGARFLFVSNNGEDLVRQESEALGIAAEKIRFVTADRAEVPGYISLANLSVVFIRPDLSKAGCSPTKLAELFAMDTPVVANAGVGDMDSIISLEKNGSSLVKDFDHATLSAALAAVMAAVDKGITIRENAQDAFSLESGTEKYRQVYAELLGQAESRES